MLNFYIKFVVVFLTVALSFLYVGLNGAGGWFEFRNIDLSYLLKVCTLSVHGKLSVVLAIVTQQNAKSNGS
jgi:hypothetical protein